MSDVWGWWREAMALGKARKFGAKLEAEKRTATLAAIGLVSTCALPRSEERNSRSTSQTPEQGSACRSSRCLTMLASELRVAETRALRISLPPCARQRKTAASSSSTAFRTSCGGRKLLYAQAIRAVEAASITGWSFRIGQSSTACGASSPTSMSTQTCMCILCRPSRLLEYEARDETGRAARRSTSRASRWPPRKGLGYRPNLLDGMERRTDLATKSSSARRSSSRIALSVRRRAVLNRPLKRSCRIIAFLTLGSRHEGVDTSRTSDASSPMTTPSGTASTSSARSVVEELTHCSQEHGLAARR